MLRIVGMFSVACGCALPLAGCWRSNEAELAEARAQAEAAREQVAKLQAELDLARAAVIITPKEALECLGQTRTVEFRVASGDVVRYSDAKDEHHKVHLADTAKGTKPLMQVRMRDDSLK